MSGPTFHVPRGHAISARLGGGSADRIPVTGGPESAIFCRTHEHLPKNPIPVGSTIGQAFA